MRVLILTTQYLPKIGGSEIAIKSLTERIHDVDFEILSSGFGGKWLFPVSGFIRCLFKKFDIIHVFQASYAGGAAWLLKIFFPRIPLIVTLQEGKELEMQSFFVRKTREMILRKADVITAISLYLLEYAKKINPKAKFYLLPNGVDINKFKNQKSKIKNSSIITSSRLVYKNGLDTLIRAMKFLPDYRLDIIGTGPLEKELKSLVKTLEIENRVSFLGNVENDAIGGILGLYGVFVRPSRSEGLGNAFLEAMAASLPIIGSRVGGIPDFLKDHETGLFCEVDNAESIAQKVRELENEALREKIVKNAFDLVQNKYNWDIIARQYHEIIHNTNPRKYANDTNGSKHS